MPSKGSYAKGVAKREEILQTALEVFSRQGYRKASLREIAEAVGLTQAGLLHYFDSKEELFAEILRKRDETDLVAFEDRDPVEALVEVIDHNSRVPGLVHLYATLSAEGTEHGHPAHEFFEERYAETISMLERGVRDGQAAGTLAADLNPVEVARMLTALADGMQIQWLLDDDVDMGAIVESFWSLLQRVR
ncbi:TetR/AcrR family transcriptional regulator [Microbacteriaceae bacterium VKM Ac-2855]|nr:TetR/AcrR family transcriptional regulator [Microbacteriaceae bacterium VKM Ac-2855]